MQISVSLTSQISNMDKLEVLLRFLSLSNYSKLANYLKDSLCKCVSMASERVGKTNIRL